MIDVKELREKSDDDLRREITALEREIWTLRFRKGDEKLGDPSRIRHKRKAVARMLTVLRERELGMARSAVAE